MLEVTILKVRHAGAREVVQSYHYINACNVVGSESNLCTAEGAAVSEKGWASLLELPPERRQKTFDYAFPPPVHFHDDVLYTYLEQSYVLALGKPLWIAERFSEKEAEKEREKDFQSLDCVRNAFASLEEGDVENFFLRWKKHQLLNKRQIDYRDREMAKNIQGAEAYLRGRYPSVAKYDPLRLLVSVGRSHFPENYLDFPVRVRGTLSSDETQHTLSDRIVILEQQGTPYQQMKHIYLALAVTIVFKLPEAEVKNLSLQELEEKVRGLTR